MTIRNIRRILKEAKDAGIEWIFFEGGEPFLYYALLVQGVRCAASSGFHIGVLSNGYWATDFEDALECLRPFAGLIQDFTISSDLYHHNKAMSEQAEYAKAAAEKLGIPIGVISIAQPEVTDSAATLGKLPLGESTVMYRGRAATVLASRAVKQPWKQFVKCTRERLQDPGRVHVDPLGNMHVCQGISIGNLYRAPLGELCERYSPESDPIIGPLLDGGPVELIHRYRLPHEEEYADACQLCYEARRALRTRFPDVLGPDQMYGVI